MRILSGLFLGLSAVALSGCVSNTYDNLTNLSNGCNASALAVSCNSTSSNTSTTPPTTTTTGPTNTNTGNTSTLSANATTDTTLALESNKAISTQSNPAVSKLSSSPLTGAAPATQSFTINTETSSNSNWPVTKTMSYYPAGGTTSTLADNPAYAEYRYFQKNTYDEELQVWSWGDSFATQYRDVTNSGTAPLHQAWSFGGNYTSASDIAALKTSGAKVNYSGSWTATAQTSNWVDSSDPNQVVSYNNNWRVRGTSDLHADFGTGAFSGDLHSTNWLAVSKDGTRIVDALDPTLDPVNILDPVMLPNVKLTGTITTSTAANTHPNQIVGTANMDASTYGWITTTGSNPMYGGFFGPGAKEVTGVFALDTAIPSPTKGNISINDDRRGYLSMSGMFHGTAP